MTFDWTINLGAVITSFVFIVGIGVYIGRLQEFIKRAEQFFEMSADDRRNLHSEIKELREDLSNRKRFRRDDT